MILSFSLSYRARKSVFLRCATVLLALVTCLQPIDATAAGRHTFAECFADSTLRLDYIFAGNDTSTAIYLDDMAMTDGWAGRRSQNMDKPLLHGNGQVNVCDFITGDTIYACSFSTLFQEWQCTPEAASVSRAFEATYLVPFPKDKVNVTVQLFNNRHEPVASLTHAVDPTDILIRQLPKTTAETRYVHGTGAPENIDIVILGDGYAADDTEKFFSDAQRAAGALFSHAPFSSYADCFNVLAVGVESPESGPDVPRNGRWVSPALGSHFDTFYSDRYLTTQSIHNIYDHIAGLPAEHIIILVNTPLYGGGGIFNQLTIASSDHPTFKQVLVHEFGHAFAGLADEYFYGDDDTTYPLDIEPWEPNITTLSDFDSKWADMLTDSYEINREYGDASYVKNLDANAPDYDSKLHHLTHDIGVYEGAGYRTYGIYRPVPYCRMRVNEVECFCPVCTRAIEQMIRWSMSSPLNEEIPAKP